MLPCYNQDVVLEVQLH